MTPFGLLLQLSGLSQREAGAFLVISPSMIDKMTRGTRAASAGVMREMRDLIERQDEAAAQAIAQIAHMGPSEIELGYPADDHEAQALGWPCVGAWRGMAARVIAATTAPITLVPRGATAGTAAAADRHGL
ncbi:hypothetical protein [Xanthobacter agilis]|uniref:XRE family transcriptional regulator n=1 Tax=Xanthobacter agilis TaxID=47492 RepID=A0ABU0LJX5_XANAG|nr:hypothetical protein [Xanthobacter agilis]MDQ0507440.1 hypothetical protein [Xanthobacter agilis]